MKEKRKIIIDSFKNGDSATNIANRLKISKSTVYRHINAGLAPQKPDVYVSDKIIKKRNSIKVDIAVQEAINSTKFFNGIAKRSKCGKKTLADAWNKYMQEWVKNQKDKPTANTNTIPATHSSTGKSTQQHLQQTISINKEETTSKMLSHPIQATVTAGTTRAIADHQKRRWLARYEKEKATKPTNRN